MLLSVAICTYNRARILGRVLEDICGQTAAQSKFQVIVVDNASTDSTKAAVNSHSDRLNIVYAYEPEQGLSRARNCALELAKTDYIAYLDDDVRLKPDWAACVLDIVEKYSPDIFGGPVFPYYDDARPKWFLDKYITFSWWGGVVHKLGSDEYLSGGNIIFKKPLLERLGGFDPRLGMCADSLGYHEEAQMVKKARETAPDLNILYVPGLAVRHLIPRRKMSLIWQVIRSYHIAKSDIILHDGKGAGCEAAFFALLKNIFYQALAVVFKTTLGVLFRDKKPYPYYQRYLMERALYNFDSLFKYFNIMSFKLKAKLCLNSAS